MTLKDRVESSIKKGKKMKSHEILLYGIHMIMRKYGGYTLKDVMGLYVTEFYALQSLIGYEISSENEAYKKAKNKGKRR